MERISRFNDHCGLIALVHIASSSRGPWAAGQAKLEAGTKVLERTVTVTGYLILYHQGSSSVSSVCILVGSNNRLNCCTRLILNFETYFKRQNSVK